MTLSNKVSLPDHLLRAISKDEVNLLPVRRYEGEVRLAETPAQVEDAIAALLAEPVVGFDTETRPAFRPGESYSPSLAQAATAHAVILFPLQRVDCSGLARVLGDERVAKAGVAMRDDLKGLRKLFEFEERAIVDLGTVAKRHGVQKTGVRTLSALFLGFRIPKGAKTTNWAARRLSPQQITYAATDAWACRELFLKFRELNLL